MDKSFNLQVYRPGNTPITSWPAHVIVFTALSQPLQIRNGWMSWFTESGVFIKTGLGTCAIILCLFNYSPIMEDIYSHVVDNYYRANTMCKQILYELLGLGQFLYFFLLIDLPSFVVHFLTQWIYCTLIITGRSCKFNSTRISLRNIENRWETWESPFKWNELQLFCSHHGWANVWV